MNEANIIYENGKHWVMLNTKNNAYEVYKTGITHSTRCAIIGKSLGLARAIAECNKREQKHNDQ